MGEGDCELAYPALSMLESTTEEKLVKAIYVRVFRKKERTEKGCCFIKIDSENVRDKLTEVSQITRTFSQKKA